MVNNIFEVKVRYAKIAQDGKEVVVTEPYLINANSFTDTEANIHKELEPYITGEFEIKSEKKSEFSELIPDENGDRWFKSKIVFSSMNEKTGIFVDTGIWVLAQASTIKEAYDNITKRFEDTVSEYIIKSISESPIVDVFANLGKDDLSDKIEVEIEASDFPIWIEGENNNNKPVDSFGNAKY